MVRVGDRLFDGSIASQLRRLEEQLQQVKVS
jgi:F0F1-type ATP synthase delta subunit